MKFWFLYLESRLCKSEGIDMILNRHFRAEEIVLDRHSVRSYTSQQGERLFHLLQKIRRIYYKIYNLP